MTVMLSPSPSTTGPRGKIPVTRAPAKNKGQGDPAMFEIVTLKTGRRRSKTRMEEISRAARPMRAGKVNSAQSVSASAPIRDCWDLASRHRRRDQAQAINGIRHIGRQGGEHRREPVAAAQPLVIGTHGGSARTRRAGSRAARRGRGGNASHAPAQSASTTSLTVQLKWFLTAFTSSSATSPRATRRCGVMARLNEVLGALKGDGRGVAPGSRLCSER